MTISSVSSSWLRRKSPHWQLSGMAGVRARISYIGVASSRRTLMKRRGMTGKWKHMWHSSPSPKYSTTSSGHWFASASSTRSG